MLTTTTTDDNEASLKTRPADAHTMHAVIMILCSGCLVLRNHARTAHACTHTQNARRTGTCTTSLAPRGYAAAGIGRHCSSVGSKISPSCRAMLSVPIPGQSNQHIDANIVRFLRRLHLKIMHDCVPANGLPPTMATHPLGNRHPAACDPNKHLPTFTHSGLVTIYRCGQNCGSLARKGLVLT